MNVMTLRPTALLLMVALLSVRPQVWAQEAGDSPGEPPVNEDQETEITEDNYRRFMELRDARIQRDAFPTEAYQAPDPLRKLGELPEASQRHLRDELRGIIVEGDGWSPDEAGTLYPYRPSDAAQGNPELRGKEAEAWEELVTSYHQREAEIYARASSKGRAGSTGGGEDRRGQESGEEGSPGAVDQHGAPLQAGEAGEEAGRNMSSGSASGGSARAAGRGMDEGVSQSALEYLAGQAGDAPGGEDRGAPGRETALSGSRSASSQADGPAAADPESGASQTAPGSAGQDAAQTAMNAAQDSAAAPASEQAEEQPDADPAAVRDAAPPIEVEYTSPGYIAIKDLVNVKGVQEPPQTPANLAEDEDD